MAIVSNLQARLSLDDSQFAAVMRKAVSNTTSAAAEMKGAFAGLGGKLAGALTIGAVASFGSTLIEYASNVHDLSNELGVSTDVYQKYGFAVKQSGGSQEAFDKSLNAIIDKTQAAIDGNEDAIKSFNRLGISLADIKAHAEHPDELFLQIVDAMSKAEAGTEEYSAAANILGSKVMLKLGESLKIGRAGFLALAESASIASRESINAAESAGDAIDSIKQGLTVAGLEVLNKVLPKQVDNPFKNPILDAQLRALSHPDSGTSNIGKFSVTDPGAYAPPAKPKPDDLAPKRLAEAQIKALEEQVKQRQEIERIISDTLQIEEDARMAAMQPAEQVLELERERGAMLAIIAGWERDIYQTHSKDIAVGNKRVAELGKAIEAQKRALALDHEFSKNAMDRARDIKEGREKDAQATRDANRGTPFTGKDPRTHLFKRANPRDFKEDFTFIQTAHGGEWKGGALDENLNGREMGLTAHGLNSFGLGKGDTFAQLLKRNKDDEAAKKAAEEKKKDALGTPGVLDRLEAKWQ